jgi:hypothetical protein
MKPPKEPPQRFGLAARAFGTIKALRTWFFMATRPSKRAIELRLALTLSAGLAVVMFSFVFIAKHFLA